jgi:acetoacetyl-CoA synthetase
LQQFFAELGLAKGDRVAAMMPNMPETIIGLLAASSMGAIFASCSPDFGETAVLDRFGQIEPRVLIVPDGYYYNGKLIEIKDKLKAILAKLPSVEKVIFVKYTGKAEEIANEFDTGLTFDSILANYPVQELRYQMVEFNHPLYILFSSGTTGVPKCIVHGTGGVLLQHLKEHQLHCDLRAGDAFFYFTTCGWMMWNWLATGLASELPLMLYDGSPFYPGPEVLFDYAKEEGFVLFGTSAKYIDAVKKSGLEPIKTHKLPKLRAVTSTGSPLVPESFEFVYNSIKPDVMLASISGGTDIVSCFVLGTPVKPVRKGEIMCAGLGLSMEVWNDNGQRVYGEKGELVCTKAFPCMPVKFWNDEGGAKYRSAYFERFDGIWVHGDFAEETPNGGYVIYGRSDATLNPGGVRIGTAEIYAQVERVPEVLEALAIGQDWQDDVRVVLFVRLREGVVLDEALLKTIKTEIKNGASPRHVPAKVIAVADIPRTKSGKITELAVRDVVHGREVKNVTALANPEALELYKNLPDLSYA